MSFSLSSGCIDKKIPLLSIVVDTFINKEGEAMHTLNLDQGIIITGDTTGEEIVVKKMMRFLPL
jgi:hypothetical protein